MIENWGRINQESGFGEWDPAIRTYDGGGRDFERLIVQRNIIRNPRADTDTAGTCQGRHTGTTGARNGMSSMRGEAAAHATNAWQDLDRVLSRKDLLPPDLDAKQLHGSRRQYSCSRPGMREPIRVTTDPAFFEEHPESYELWSPGSPIFPEPDDSQDPDDVTAQRSKLAAIFRNLTT